MVNGMVVVWTENKSQSSPDFNLTFIMRLFFNVSEVFFEGTYVMIADVWPQRSLAGALYWPFQQYLIHMLVRMNWIEYVITYKQIITYT